VTFESIQALGHSLEPGEVVGSEDRSLHDGEVDLDLVQPAGVHGCMDDDEARILLLEPLNRACAAM